MLQGPKQKRLLSTSFLHLFFLWHIHARNHTCCYGEIWAWFILFRWIKKNGQIFFNYLDSPGSDVSIKVNRFLVEPSFIFLLISVETHARNQTCCYEETGAWKKKKNMYRNNSLDLSEYADFGERSKIESHIHFIDRVLLSDTHFRKCIYRQRERRIWWKRWITCGVHFPKFRTIRILMQGPKSVISQTNAFYKSKKLFRPWLRSLQKFSVITEKPVIGYQDVKFLMSVFGTFGVPWIWWRELVRQISIRWDCQKLWVSIWYHGGRREASLVGEIEFGIAW